ncbi:MAG: hypothetical protein HY723_01720, partial [Chloroflexi bacterium]|nr:hypothetical protein [Chloroflexota bacterium]
MRLDPAALKITAAPSTSLTIDVVVEEVTDLGAFEFEFAFDSAFVKLEGIRIGPFLGSTDRPVTCQQRTMDSQRIMFGCNTFQSSPPGATGTGVVAHIDLTVQNQAVGETSLRLNKCSAADVLGASIPLNGCKDTKFTVNAPTPTPTPKPRLRKLPPHQNLFLTRQGEKIPPVQCAGPQGSDDVALYLETMSSAVSSPDPKQPDQPKQLAAFEFEVRHDPRLVCVELQPGVAAAGMTCVVFDALTKPTLEGVARIGCVTLGKDGPFPDTSTVAGRHLANVLVRPQPQVYTQMKPAQGNGLVADLVNAKCELADVQGHPIKLFSCDDAKLIIRYLEGDVEPDCLVNALDTQSIAFRWGATKGSLIYNDRFNLEPSGAQADNDIDIKDLQFVYGRFGSDCEDPHPPQPPAPEGKQTATPTATATPPDSTKPRINKSPTDRELVLTAPAASGECADSPDAVMFEVLIKDEITSPDPKTPTLVQELGAFEFVTHFDPSVVCVEVAPGDIPLGEMNCSTINAPTYVQFGCTTLSSSNPPQPQPPGVLAVVTVRPHPDVFDLLFPVSADQLLTQILNDECELADLLGHPIKT